MAKSGPFGFAWLGSAWHAPSGYRPVTVAGLKRSLRIWKKLAENVKFAKLWCEIGGYWNFFYWPTKFIKLQFCSPKKQQWKSSVCTISMKQHSRVFFSKFLMGGGDSKFLVPIGDGWDLRKKSDWSQNCPLNAKLGHFLLFQAWNTAF